MLCKYPLMGLSEDADLAEGRAPMHAALQKVLSRQIYRIRRRKEEHKTSGTRGAVHPLDLRASLLQVVLNDYIIRFQPQGLGEVMNRLF